MNQILSYLLLIVFVGMNCFSCNETTQKAASEQGFIKEVNPSLFISNKMDFQIETVNCTLSDGTKTKCYEITTTGIPTDHKMGPWCPDHIDDGPDKGGFWMKDGTLYNVDGAFIKELPILYNDDYWRLYDDEGNVFKTKTKEDCLELAGARLVDKFTNYCIECLPSYVMDLSKKYIIPITPIKLENPTNLGGPPQGKAPAGEKPQGPPPGGGKGGPVVRGIAFNGVAFDAPAPLHIILAGYTIPPIDHAGGHINMDAGYHYHAATGATKEVKQNDGHAPMIGYAMDGFGLYAQLNEDGKEPQDLDECRGHSDEVRGYHYHVDAAGSNNFINCFSGALAE